MGTCHASDSSIEDEHVKHVQARHAGKDLSVKASPKAKKAFALDESKDKTVDNWTERHPFEMGFEEEPPDLILEFMYLGSHDNAWDSGKKVDAKKKELRDLNIGFILVVGEECEMLFQDDFKYLKLDIKDDCNDAKKLFECLPAAFEFIDECRNSDKNILVHGYDGISRAPAVVIAYLMSRGEVGYDRAFKHVKKRRPIIRPIKAFADMLQSVEMTSLTSTAAPTPAEASQCQSSTEASKSSYSQEAMQNHQQMKTCYDAKCTYRPYRQAHV